MDPVDGPILASLLGNCMCHCKHLCRSTHSSNIICHTLVWAYVHMKIRDCGGFRNKQSIIFSFKE